MSKIKKISVSNLKAISAKTIDFNGCTAIITGGNGKGKTSFIRSLMDRFKGIKNDKIVRQGEVNGNYEMELTTGEKLIWEFDLRGKEKMIYISEKNIRSSVTKELRDYFFPPSFDVDAFLNQQPAQQRKTLEKMAGIDFTELNKRLKEAEENRTFYNKKEVEEKLKLGNVIDSLPEVEDTTALEAAQAKLNNASADNERIKGVQQRLNDKKQILQANEASIKELRDKIESLHQANMLLETDIDKGNAWLADPRNKLKTDADLAAIRTEIQKIKDSNKLIEDNNKAKLQQKTWEKSVKAKQEADDEVKKIIKDKDEAIRMANLPEGFGFDEEGITYNGFSFDRSQLASSAIYIGALKLASRTMGEVRALHFDASTLDRNSLKEISEWAASQDLQLLIERPDFEGGDIKYEITEVIK